MWRRSRTLCQIPGAGVGVAAAVGGVAIGIGVVDDVNDPAEPVDAVESAETLVVDVADAVVAAQDELARENDPSRAEWLADVAAPDRVVVAVLVQTHVRVVSRQDVAVSRQEGMTEVAERWVEQLAESEVVAVQPLVAGVNAGAAFVL
jgi:hypothetical protein